MNACENLLVFRRQILYSLCLDGVLRIFFRQRHRENLGKISDVLQTGANDVYVIKNKGVKDILVPAIEQCVREVNLEENRIVIHLLPGLR